jgi:hypothetical protein
MPGRRSVSRKHSGRRVPGTAPFRLTIEDTTPAPTPANSACSPARVCTVSSRVEFPRFEAALARPSRHPGKRMSVPHRRQPRNGRKIVPSAPGLPRRNLLCMGLFCEKPKSPSPVSRPQRSCAARLTAPSRPALPGGAGQGADSPGGHRSEVPAGSRTSDRWRRRSVPALPDPLCRTWIAPPACNSVVARRGKESISTEDVTCG